MKKIVITGATITLALALVGCGSNASSNDAEKISSLKSQNSSLKVRISSLKEENEILDNDDSNEDFDDSDSSNSHVLKFGESAEFESGEKITVNSAKDVSNVELMEAEDGQTGVAVSITVENTKSSPIEFNAQNFSLYDGKDVNANFDANSYSNNIPDDIAAGMKATFTIYFDVTTKGEYSVAFGDAIWRNK